MWFFSDSTTGNNFTCTCTPGFQGVLCDIAFCAVESCKNGGICLTDETVPECHCQYGFDGKYCENDIGMMNILGC